MTDEAGEAGLSWIRKARDRAQAEGAALRIDNERLTTERDAAHAELAKLREQLGDAKTEWGVQRHGFMNRLFPKIAVDWMSSEVEARHEAANPTKPGTVVTRLVGEWRKVDES